MLLFIPEKSLHKAMTFSTFHTATLARRSGVPGMLGGDTAGRGAPNWPKGYSRPYDIMLMSKAGGKRRKRGDMFGVMAFAFPSHHYM